MQVMPGTGRDTAAALDITYESDRALSDPDYNALLGTAYIADLNARFDGNIVLVSAGYYAGPGRALEWIARFGDPRDEDADGILYWIEAIPFSETRNYIMRVTESIPIYEAQLTGELPAIGMTERLLR
jgi:soluble lytic murein transglycosylase